MKQIIYGFSGFIWELFTSGTLQLILIAFHHLRIRYFLVILPSLFLLLSSGIRVVSNAGGINPLACGAALTTLAQKNDIDLKVAVITGDNLVHEVDNIRESGIKAMDSGEAFPSHLQSMNLYLGYVKGSGFVYCQ